MRVEVIIQKTKVKVVIYTVFSMNDVSSKMMRRLKLAPELNFGRDYVNSFTASIYALGDYSVLSILFVKLLLTPSSAFSENLDKICSFGSNSYANTRLI